MMGIIDNVLVGLALLISVGYAAMSLGPKSMRRALLGALSRLLARAPVSLGLRRSAERLANAAGKAQGACGGCDGCASEQPVQAPRSEVRIPVTHVGRRS